MGREYFSVSKMLVVTRSSPLNSVVPEQDLEEKKKKFQKFLQKLSSPYKAEQTKETKVGALPSVLPLDQRRVTIETAVCFLPEQRFKKQKQKKKYNNSLDKGKDMEDWLYYCE